MGAPISGNLDSPEGGFDALMQAIVCKVCLVSVTSLGYQKLKG